LISYGYGHTRQTANSKRRTRKIYPRSGFGAEESNVANETVKLTVVVIVISILVGAFIGSLDSLFLRATTFLFKR
jgi:hypothetical protein